jgi:hypothetical protein
MEPGKQGHICLTMAIVHTPTNADRDVHVHVLQYDERPVLSLSAMMPSFDAAVAEHTPSQARLKRTRTALVPQLKKSLGHQARGLNHPQRCTLSMGTLSSMQLWEFTGSFIGRESPLGMTQSGGHTAGCGRCEPGGGRKCRLAQDVAAQVAGI